jgi:hypothetical protein
MWLYIHTMTKHEGGLGTVSTHSPGTTDLGGIILHRPPLEGDGDALVLHPHVRDHFRSHTGQRSRLQDQVRFQMFILIITILLCVACMGPGPAAGRSEVDPTLRISVQHDHTSSRPAVNKSRMAALQYCS